MSEPILLFVIAAFLLAGFVKGVIGLGLPTVSVGLLATAMPPSRAIAIVIVPAIITNIWQTFVGPYLRDIVRRLWPLMAGTAIGAWLLGYAWATGMPTVRERSGSTMAIVPIIVSVLVLKPLWERATLLKSP